MRNRPSRLDGAQRAGGAGPRGQGLEADDPIQAYARALTAKAKQVRLPQLFCEPQPNSYYQRIDRNGISSIAIAQRHLSDAVVEDILRFRLANAMLYGHVDPKPIFERRSECEWWFTGCPDDVLLFAGSNRSGEIGSHTALAFLPDATPEATLRTPNRRLFEAEQVYGWQVFHRLPIVPYLPLNRLVEPRRLVKTYWLDPLDELAFRAPAELGVASFHATLALVRSIDVILGEMTTEAQRNMDFFGTAFVTFDAEPVEEEPPIFHLPVEHVRTTLWAMLTSEAHTSSARVAEIERALELSGRACLQQLLRLGADAPHKPSQVLRPLGPAWPAEDR